MGESDNKLRIINNMNVTKLREFRVFCAVEVGEGHLTYSMGLGKLSLNV